jgi:tripartite-type tricarboxylate transporter receptor subunit TctC
MIMFRSNLRRGVAAIALAATALSAAAQTWPQRPIRLVSPGAPGTTSDLLVRVIFEPVAKALGQPYVLDFKPGAGTTLAVSDVAKSAPDGYSFITGSVAGLAIAPSLYAKLAYDPMKDFEHVALLVKMPNLLVVNNGVPAKNVQELVAHAKANPGKLNYATSGAGTSFHLSAVLLAQAAGIDLVHVPYKNNTASNTAIIAGDVHMVFDNLITVLPYVRAGKLRALAITTAQRSPDAPDVPTMIEAGIPHFDVSSWFGLAGPLGTPRAIVDRMAAEVSRSMTSPEVSAALRKLGANTAFMGPADFRAFNRDEIARWAPVVKASGATVN